MQRRTVIFLGLLAAVVGAASLGARLTPHAPAPQTAVPRYATEQEWIVASVVQAIAAMAGERIDASVAVTADNARSGVFVVTVDNRPPVRLVAAPHIWSPDAYAQVAITLVKPDSPDITISADDLSARRRLSEASVPALLDENDRISAALQQNMHSAAAQEAAALLVGTFALRESAGLFDDVRPALARLAAHLALAQVLRGSAPEGLDGVLARAVLTVLAGLQRDALAIVDGAEPRATGPADRAWLRALRLRITGDWRESRPVDDAPAIERLEYARAVAALRGIDPFLDYVDTLPPDERTDWHRIAFRHAISVEAGNRYTTHDLDLELAEAAAVRMRLRGDSLVREDLIAALNDAPATTAFVEIDGQRVVAVLDWGTWAAFAQRHVCHDLLAHNYQLNNLGRGNSQDELIREFDQSFGQLALYPIVVRWIAKSGGHYDRAMAMARPLAIATPERLTAAAWNILLERPAFAVRDVAFPLDIPWFTPAVPAGTAFDIASRALRPGCPRPATRQQAARWAADRPYDHWTQWGAAYLALDEGAPTPAVVRRAFGPLLDYDEGAVRKIIDYTVKTEAERITAAATLCDIAPSQCDVFAELLLRENRNADAAVAFERWIDGTRDAVRVSNGLTWITRYHLAHGSPGRAEALARQGADTGSAGGMAALAELLERQGRHAEAEALYRTIAERYTHRTEPLAAFLIRQAKRRGDAAGQLAGETMLRPVFADGLQEVALHALPVQPTDGVIPATFGARAAATGLRHDDIVVGVDDWRVHTVAQYSVVASLSHEDSMLVTVWRKGHYRRLRLLVPQRWFGIQWADYAPPSGAR
jgi:hypothetical protein